MIRARQLAQDLDQVWNSPTTTNRDRKRLLRCLIDEVQLATEEKRYRVRIVWKGGAVTAQDVARLTPGPTTPKTSQDTVELDGVYAANADGLLEFHELPPPEDREVLQVLTRISEGVRGRIERWGLEKEPERAFGERAGSGRTLCAVRNRIASGPNAGHRVVALGGDRIDGDSLEALSTPRCAAINGFNLPQTSPLPGSTGSAWNC
jgi:hypothetical protein